MTSASATDFLERIDQLRIRVQVEGGQLRVTAPAGALTPELRAEIAGWKPELLRLLSGSSPAQPGGEPPIARVERHGPMPASFAQKSLWLFQQLQPDSAAYNIPGTLRLRGALDAATLARSLTEIVRRHEALRTTFDSRDGEPVQIIREAGSIDLPLVDLTDVPASERTMVMNRQLCEQAQRPFDLTLGPLFRPRLWKLAPDDHVLQLNVHHIVFDGWSYQVLMAELEKIYSAGGSAAQAGMSDLPLQFADYAGWQQKWIASAACAGHARFWEKMLAGAPELLELPADRPRPVRPSHRGGHLSRVFPAPLVEALNVMRRSEKTTLFMVLYAAFKVLLHRYTNQADIVVGTPVANRTREAFESMVGFFVNVLPIRTSIAANTRFRALLRQVQDTTLDAFAHQDIPFDQIVETINPHRSASHSPLFQVLFTHRNTRQAVLSLPGLQVEWLPAQIASAKFDLSIYVTEGAQSLSVGAEFSTDLFDAATVERWLANYEQLLRSITTRPDQSIATLPLLTATEHRQVVDGWNDTTTDAPRDGCIAQLIETQVARTPEATALVVRHDRLTFAALNRQANQLAHHLRSLGVGPEVLVGICLPRNVDLIVALLAVHKAGGAYVPLDPDYPPDRLAYILEHARAGVLLTHSSLRAMLPATSAGDHPRVDVCLDLDGGLVAGQPTENPAPSARPTNLSHVIYTSGSTGRPKGVAIEHRNVTSLMHWARRVYPQNEIAGVLACTSVCFDLSVFEIFTPLCWGGTIHLAANALELPELPARDEITLVNTVPSAITELLRAGGIPQSVHVLNLAGEPLPRELVDQLYALPQVRKVHDLYGPTEDTVYSTSALRQPGTPATIGRPLDNKRVYLLDSHRQPVPIGIPGEVYIGGEGVARGYLNQPELTAERFLADPFAGRDGARMYRTGDLARYRADGNLEFLGRLDHQIKLRGFRIELGEIESVLRTHADVAGTAVMAREDTPGAKRLAAYVVGKPGTSPGAAELRAFLQTRLPEYMIPSAFVTLEQLPLTPNGKVDRKALPVPDDEALPATAVFIAARTPVETAMAQIWRGLLGVERVGVHDNFFDLGGHSLLAMKAAAQISAATGCRLPVRWLFDCGTIAELAVRLGHAPEARSDERIVPLARTGRLPLSHEEQRLWFLHHALSDPSTYNVPWATRLRGPLDVARLRDALRVVMQRHEILRTSYVEHEGVATRLIAADVDVPLEVLDLRLDRGSSIEVSIGRFVAAEAARPFALESPPLIRATCLRVGPEDHVFVLNAHHIICDEWSLQILRNEVETLYAAAGSATADLLPELPLQYADYAAWQCQLVASSGMDRERDYWRRQLQDAPTTLALPIDRRRPDRPSHRGAQSGFILERSAADALEQLGSANQATPFMVWLAAFSAFLTRLSGQTDLVIGTPLAARTLPEVQSLIGFFLNTLPIRVRIDGATSFRALVEQVRTVVLDSFEHGSLPLDEIVVGSAASPSPQAAGSAPFPVMFVLNEGTREDWQLPGTTAETLHPSTKTAKADLTLFLRRLDDQCMRGSFEYSTDLFTTESINRIVGQWTCLVDSMTRSPDAAISELELLPPEQRRQLVAGFNPPPAPYPHDATVQALFEQCAAATPAATALILGPHKVSYIVLNERANQLAHHLRALGVHTGDRVVLLLDHSIELVVSVLATLKAGAVYVPLDPHFPAARLRFMLEDTAARVLITHGALPPDIGVGGITILDLAQEAGAVTRCATTNPDATRVANDPAYIMYTSGSTGRPKGVVIPHRGIVRLVRGQSYVPFTPAQRFLLLASPAFDASTFELWGALLNGATCVIFPERLPDFEQLEREIRAHGVSCVWLTAGLFNQIIDQRPGVLATVRHLVTGGEALSVSHVQRALEQLPQLQLVNGYGPTESTTFACTFAIQRDAARAFESVPIGRPINHTRCYILDALQNPVPIGVAGELYIGGDGLACGYLNNPELESARFVPDPFGAEPGASLYRTGDRCRWLPEGHIEFLGRFDDQIKLRGFRIELGEIDAVLREHPAVNEVVVTTWLDGAGERRLVAYLTPRANHRPAKEALRAHLQEKLPDYMVPSAIVMLEQLPLTPNGKVDRNALPAPDVIETTTERALVEPRTETEKKVAGVWREILKLSRVGVHDNFFNLGGHSLLAMRVTARLSEAFGREVPLPWLFAHPTVEALAGCIAGMAAPEKAGAIPVVNRTESMALSSDEQRLWFVHHALADRSTYNVPWAKRLRGPLNPDLVRAVLAVVMQRHEILRTSYVERDGSVVRVIHGDCAVPFRAQMLPCPDGETVEAALARWVEEENNRPFDLARAPLLRLTCVRLDNDDHALVLVAHHIICDEWSLRLLGDELAALYASGGDVAASRLPVLPVQYADYAAWQQNAIKAMDAHRTYWRTQLEAAPTTVELPFDHPRPEFGTNRGGRVRLEIAPDTVRNIEAIGREAGATTFVVWLTAYAVLLHRLSGQDDIVIGTPLANRGRREVQALIGFFLNTLPIRLRVKTQSGFREFVRAVRTVALEGVEHGQLPLDHIAATGTTVRSAAAGGLFSVMFVHLEEAPDRWSLPSTTATGIAVQSATAKADLTMFMQRSLDGSMAAGFEFDSDLFDANTVERFAVRFLTLLESMVARPDEPIGRLALLPDDERRELQAWSGSETHYPRDATIHALFEEQARTSGDRTALICGETTVSYGELDRWADDLANRLGQLGVTRGAHVAIYLGRSIDFVIAVLGVLKAGGAYVPLEMDAPPARLQVVLEDTAARVVVADSPLPDIPGSACLTQIRARTSDRPTALAGLAVTETGGALDPAYVMFTSGSTGRPKGAVIPHRAVVRLVRGQSYAPFDANQRFLFLASPAFDASTFEIWGPLLNGATCVIFPERWPDFSDLEDAIRRHGVTCLWLTAGLFNQIIDERPEVLATVRDVLTGGEALSVAHVQRALGQLPDLRLINGYGPTESTTFACTYLIPRDIDLPGSVPIGRPLANTRCHILDDRGRPAPVGVSGELHIGGDGLALGYLLRPELTAAKFVPDTFSAEPDARLYRSGDRCRWLPDGTIEFLGRLDDQLKIRGFRIEPGEIKTVLESHPAVGAAVVVVREDSPGDRRLVAYFECRKGTKTTPDELRQLLRARLPDYMVPAALVPVERLPLTANGKVDRMALPAPDRVSHSAPESPAPRHTIEIELVSIWKRMLKLDHVGLTDNFFEIGGHSLLALRLVFEIEKRFGRKLSLQSFLTAPTIEQVSQRLICSAQSSEEIPELRGQGSGAPLFHVPGIDGVGLLPSAIVRLIDGKRTYFDALQYPGMDGSRAPLDRIEDIAAALFEQIRRVRPHGPYCLTGFCFGGLVAYEIARKMQLAGEEVAALILWDTQPAQCFRRRPWRKAVAILWQRIRETGGHEWLRALAPRMVASAKARVKNVIAWIAARSSRPLPRRDSDAALTPDEISRQVKAAGLRALAAYRPGPYHGRVDLFQTKSLPDKRIRSEPIPFGGWQGIICGLIRTHAVDCGHHDMLQEPVVSEVAQQTVACLHAAEREREISETAIVPERKLVG